MKVLKLLGLTICFAFGIQASAGAQGINDVVNMGTQAAPLTLMINGPSGLGTVPIEFWVDKISIEDTYEQSKKDVALFRIPQAGYVLSFPTNFTGDLNRLLGLTNNLWWVPEVGLVSASAGPYLNFNLYTKKTGSRAGARIVIEDNARKLEKPIKGLLVGEWHEVNLSDTFDRDLFYSPEVMRVPRQFKITNLLYVKQTWVIDMESVGGESAAHIVLDSNFKIKMAKRTK